MIRMELAWAAALYLSACLAIFMAASFLKKVKGLPNRSVSDRSVWHCEVCTFFYIDSRHSGMSACPRCGSYNKRQGIVTEKEGKA